MTSFYQQLSDKRQDSPALQLCVKNTVKQLSTHHTSVVRPGMLLGKIQSGKTRAFIGVIAESFDQGYDIVIVLTKGTIALAEQTYQRLAQDLGEFIDNDEISVRDIMHLPENLTGYELQQKMVIVVKKQTDNLRRIIKALIETYPNLGSKRLLIIDDEADYASIGFYKSKEDTIELRKIAGQIDELRKKVSMEDFLQVTATPYSLYLQPEIIAQSEGSENYESVKPAFTELLPIGEGYVGGEFYFENSKIGSSTASYIYEEVDVDELQILKEPDGRRLKLDDVLESKKIKSLRKAIMNFIVGGSLRRLQQRHEKQRELKYSFTIHTELRKASHEWQLEVVSTIKDKLIEEASKESVLLNELIKDSFEDLERSLILEDNFKPDFQDVKKEVYEVLRKDYLMITKVNSENDVKDMLDDKGQLRLRTPLNIFIGGQILDRGITINNLIGFYYGRRPKRSQQDAVLQHSRMFGYRSLADMVVTRFYTTIDIYEIMEKIHEYDTALREAFEAGAQDEVVFIHRDTSNKIVPCAPSKILCSTTTTLRPSKWLLPFGFQTGYKSHIKDNIEKIDNILKDVSEDSEGPFLIDLSLAKVILDLISETLIFEDGYEWDQKAFISSLEYLSKNSTNIPGRGKLLCLLRYDRSTQRIRKEGRFANVPITGSDAEIAGEAAIDLPILVLTRQKGEEDYGWMGSPFWWPLLITPKNIKTVIFASDLKEDN